MARERVRAMAREQERGPALLVRGLAQQLRLVAEPVEVGRSYHLHKR